MRDRDDEESELDDPDELDENEASLMPCPHCLGTIHDESERCPHCGEYLSEEDIPHRPAWWIVVGVIVCLLVVLRWIF